MDGDSRISCELRGPGSRHKNRRRIDMGDLLILQMSVPSAVLRRRSRTPGVMRCNMLGGCLGYAPHILWNAPSNFRQRRSRTLGIDHCSMRRGLGGSCTTYSDNHSWDYCHNLSFDNLKHTHVLGRGTEST